jgi:hypoxanthine-DNA glycosylase
MEYQHITHPFEPIYHKDSTILILGTLPSVKSRENDFYYGHKQNRFWRLLAALYDETVPETINEKKELLFRNHIALWDVIAECDIQGSSDSTIRNVKPTDIRSLLEESAVQRIFANGRKAGELYGKYQQKLTGVDITVLPSTSPANAVWPLERLLPAWQEIKE